MIVRTPPFALATIIATAIGLASQAAAQESELWLSAEFRAELVDDLNLTVGPELRFNERMSRLDEILPGLDLSYEPLKFLKLGTGYRFEANRRNNGDFRFGHRVQAEVTASYEVSLLEFAYRLRYEHTVARKDGEALLSDELRQRLGVEIDAHDIVRPFADVEVYAELRRTPVALETYRLTTGLALRLDDHRVEVFYRYKHAIDAPAEPVVHILGLGYRFKL